MLKKSTLQLLRFHFSLFLMPVFFFALALQPHIKPINAVLIFIILHLLVYPASNGYNSYMDRDESAIGGIRNPMQPTVQLYYVTIIMDTAAVLISLFISYWFALGILCYILVSHAYSYRGIRLKKYPIVGYITVVVFQGAFTFVLVYSGAGSSFSLAFPLLPAIASSLLIGGFYPLTQIYQHQADLKDGVKTISYLLGYRGTFIFTGIVYSFAMFCLFIFFSNEGTVNQFLMLTTMLLPVLVYFIKWAIEVWHNNFAADYNHTMKLNVIASICTSAAFIILLIWRTIE
jgi:1,4-dihydroxy-2-naphthoate octaprenyltransferase